MTSCGKCRWWGEKVEAISVYEDLHSLLDYMVSLRWFSAMETSESVCGALGQGWILGLLIC